MWLLTGLGAIVGGLFLALRELLPWLQARRSGVLWTRSARSQVVRRADDPERFQNLLQRRYKAAGLGLLLFAAGAAWLILNMLGLFVQAA